MEWPWTHGIEDADALVVVQVRVEVVDADRVDAEDLHKRGVASAGLGVTEGVMAVGGVPGRATGLVVHADDLEAVAGVRVDKVPALNLEGRDGGGKRRRDGEQRGGELARPWLAGIGVSAILQGRGRPCVDPVLRNNWTKREEQTRWSGRRHAERPTTKLEGLVVKPSTLVVVPKNRDPRYLHA